MESFRDWSPWPFELRTGGLKAGLKAALGRAICRGPEAGKLSALCDVYPS